MATDGPTAVQLKTNIIEIIRKLQTTQDENERFKKKLQDVTRALDVARNSASSENTAHQEAIEIAREATQEAEKRANDCQRELADAQSNATELRSLLEEFQKLASDVDGNKNKDPAEFIRALEGGDAPGAGAAAAEDGDNEIKGGRPLFGGSRRKTHTRKHTSDKMYNVVTGKYYRY